MTPPQLTDAQVRRLAAWEAAHLEVEPTAVTPRQPVQPMMGPRWAELPPPTPEEKPGFGTGVVVALVLVGVFALGWQVVTRMDPTGLAFFAGTMLALGVVFATLLLAIYLGEHIR